MINCSESFLSYAFTTALHQVLDGGVKKFVQLTRVSWKTDETGRLKTYF